MARKKDSQPLGAMDGFFTEEPEEKKSGYNPKSLENLGPRKAGTAKPKAFMQLNIYEYEDYIYRMSKVQGKTMSKYVLDLIQKDMTANAAAYAGLRQIKELDKPARIPRNTKKN